MKPKKKPDAAAIKAKQQLKKIEEKELNNSSLMESAQSFYIIFKYEPTEVFEMGAENFDDAVKIARKMNQDLGKFGKRAAIYAVNSNDHRDIVKYEY
jgi:hypothetical protein